MNDFRKSLEVKRIDTGEILITKSLGNLLIEHMKGNITKKELMAITGIGDKGTIDIKIQQLVSSNYRLKSLFDEYMSRKNKDFNGYNFRAEAIEMLRKDISQTQMAEDLGINRRTFSTKMKQLQEQNEDNALGKLLKEHASRMMNRQSISTQELIMNNIILDNYEEENPVGKLRYENRTSQEISFENAIRVVNLVESLRKNGMTLKEISEKGIISEAIYRKYKERLQNLNEILQLNGEKEK